MSTIMSYFNFPPGAFGLECAARVLRLVLDDFGWVTPTRVGRLTANRPITPPNATSAALAATCAEQGVLSVKGKGGELLVKPARGNTSGGGGFLVWYGPGLKRPSDRRRHAEQCAAVCKLLGSPLAYACLPDDYAAKRSRDVARGKFIEEVPRVRGYREGLLALFWLNFLGPPFSELMAARLSALPSDVATDLGGGYWRVTPYDDPEIAMTDEGRRREAERIEQIGTEFFYDMAREQPPQVRPNKSG